MKTILTVATVAIVLLVGGNLWTRSLEKDALVSGNGLHWHPELTIFAKGESVEIPANIGLSAVHQPVHTHDDVPIVHLEFSGRVTEDDIKLARFFENWGKDLGSFGVLTKMLVNGIEHTERGEYVMREGDKIELHYE